VFNASSLKRKYHALANKWHPDKNPNSTNEKFMEIKSAYETLKDPERRKYYDVYG